MPMATRRRPKRSPSLAAHSWRASGVCSSRRCSLLVPSAGWIQRSCFWSAQSKPRVAAKSVVFIFLSFGYSLAGTRSRPDGRAYRGSSLRVCIRRRRVLSVPLRPGAGCRSESLRLNVGALQRIIRLPAPACPIQGLGKTGGFSQSIFWPPPKLFTDGCGGVSEDPPRHR